MQKVKQDSKQDTKEKRDSSSEAEHKDESYVAEKKGSPQKQCPKCKKWMLASNLRRHMQTCG